jgi:hypothetical protein
MPLKCIRFILIPCNACLSDIFMAEASMDGGYVWNGMQFIWTAEGSRRSATGVPQGVSTPIGFGTLRPGFGVSREQGAHILATSRQFVEQSTCNCDAECEVWNDCCLDYVLECGR